jgi:hypothetical protein
MDNIPTKRAKKADKDKRTKELNGQFSQKHVRHLEYLQEKRKK